MTTLARSRATGLRQRATDVERTLWFALRDRRFCGAKFRRQVPIGPYIVDFLCKEAGLVLELDGGQRDATADGVRDAWLAGQGYSVRRFWNNQVVENLPGVLEVLADDLERLRAGRVGIRSGRSRRPHPGPLPRAGEGEEGRVEFELSSVGGRGQGEGGEAGGSLEHPHPGPLPRAGEGEEGRSELDPLPLAGEGRVRVVRRAARWSILTLALFRMREREKEV